jgi:hypothetical protein
MVETHEYRGLWWLPNDEEEQLSGTLTVTKGEASLELIGHFGHELLSETPTEKVFSHALAEHPRIVGMSTDGKSITLEGHRTASYTESFPGIPTGTYTRYVTLIGKQFADGEEIGFDEISIRASDLNAWTQVAAIRTKVGVEKHKTKGYPVFSKLDINFEAPDDIEIPLARGEKAFIRFNAPGQGINPGTDHVALTQEAALHLRFAKRASLDDVFERGGQIRNFLSLAVGRPVAILSVTGYQDDYVRESSDTHLPIQVLWGILHNPEPPTRPRQAREMLFTLPEATPDISTVMKHWFAKQARLRPVFNLFFGMLYHPSMYSDVKFLAFAQAVETYDYRRRRKPGKWTLAQRMLDVLGQCRTVSKKIVGSASGDEATFIEDFKTSRNYYTHYNPKLEKKAATGAALLLLTTQLQALIEMSLLRQLGFSARSIDALLQRIRRYEQIEHLKAFVAEEGSAK